MSLTRQCIAEERRGLVTVRLLRRQHHGSRGPLAVDYALVASAGSCGGALSFLGYDEGEAVERFNRAVHIAEQEAVEKRSETALI